MTAAALPKAGQANAVPVSLDDRYALERGRILVSGTQALVRLPLVQRQRDLAAGLNTAGYVSGYRGSPLAGFDREMQRAGKYLRANHVVFHPGLNEDMAATAVWGTQQTGMFAGSRYDGVFSMWYGKGPGVDRTMDVIRHANAVGTNRHGGVLLLVGDDHGAVSSTLPHQSEHNLISAMVPLLSPGGVGEYIDYGLLGWAMSRYSGAWIGFKCQTEIVECTATVDVDPARLGIVTPELPLPADGLSLRWPDGPHAMERRIEHKMAAVHAFARANGIDRIVHGSGKARLGIVSTGKSWLDLLGALSALGIDERRAAELGIRLYKVGMVWPLEPEGLKAFSQGLEEILVVEEKRPVLEDQIKALLFNAPDRPRVFGKMDERGAPLLPSIGEISAVSVARAIVSRLGAPDAELGLHLKTIEAVAASAPGEVIALKRDPYFCSGCPHSISTVVPDGSRASTGIGCHMMVIGMERETSTFTQMGGEGGAWIGLSPFTDERHIFVNMGDGTYFHSGLLAIRAAIAAKVSATYKILYNDAVAMTGGQRHDGEVSVPSIVEQTLAEGAKRVVVVSEKPEAWAGVLPRSVTIHHRDELDAVQRELREIEGVTVLVFDQVCAAEKRRRRKRGAYPVSPKRAFINELVCEGCGDCSAVSNCISIEPEETEFGRKRRINQSSCNTDLSCIKGFCPSFVTVEGGTIRKPKARAVTAGSGELPMPALAALDRPYNMLLAGIGGTGVITVSAILSQAAHLDGLGLLTLDQTGLAQKNGAVISHIRLARDPDLLNTVRIGPGEADLVLGFDIVVSASATSLSTFAHGRTRAVLDDHFAPTASFVQNTAIDFRQEATLKQLRRAAGEEAVTLVSATKLGLALMGDAIAANMFLLGNAWQRGLVPISLTSIDRAIEMNGAGVAMNHAAFGWGRRAAIDLAAVLNTAQIGSAEATKPETLDAMVARRMAFLTDYQNAAYANRYRKLVETARAAEAGTSAGSEDFAKAVAVGAFKLMAYKDEYEVARLHRDQSFRKKLAEQFEGDFRIRHHLAPPMISRIDPRTGHPGKIAFGTWINPVFAMLAWLKGLRGTRFDPFGRTQERRMERRMVADYEGLISGLSARLTPSNHAVATELARLPEEVRGFGHVKMAAVERFETKKKALLAKLGRESRLETAA
ncbi:indolepyruvate ferredoxin oxidoreductase family protein [Mesorhizobium sp. M6A.T.Cr.TU.017.01.1.1]|uniref:indolepyruvate ferredoxin oxidoreductase family protein n=1 Tax=Mesorhizobium sp. M6A.T.Cr.TU.017.01.1.1 TaxID=2496774 RepID=UPI000FD5931C|nr:indolepyruvate ferredoxin oxidoreductase family protein [Mesorhizobium sp. M6A.T.Cr.TU.017.01.1.1]RUV04575.1 indolepyruvate ferredoxin oxidoreductase family protein [Mesorhizobium sp. M6A.T.Cr.TU.017.01.1.1]